MEFLVSTKTILVFILLASILQSSLVQTAKAKKAQTASMIDNWKKEQLSKLDPAQAKINEWFNIGCKSPGLTPRDSRRVVRQEYRTLTGKQRYLFHACLKVMLETPAVLPFWNQNEYESFVTQHKFQFSPEAHGTPAFAPYHRVLLHFFEKVIHSHPGCETVGIPYWDSTLDSYLPDPSMSAMFAGKTYMGTTHGEVEGELFKNWQKIVLKSCQFYGENLTRDMCRDPDQMLKDSMIDRFLNCHNYTACVYPQDKSFEENHGLIHGCVKGHMSELMCAPYDPIFWLHHAFIDYIFEEWLTKHFPDVAKDDPTAVYPHDDTIEEYYNKGSQPMRPFDKSGYKVKDGMSRNFTRDFYWYAPRPHKCSRDEDCMSAMIWCDVKEGRCKAKAGEGGSCEGLPDEACYCRPNTTPRCSKLNITCECLESIQTIRSFVDARSESSSSSPSSSYSSSPSSTYPSSPLTFPTPPLPPATSTPSPPPQTALTPPTIPQPCTQDKDCPPDEWCNGICTKKIGLGGSCGTLPDRACSGSLIVANLTNLLWKCHEDIEEPKCSFGRCMCRFRVIRCGFEAQNACPENMFCSLRLRFCLSKSRPGRGCDASIPFDSCGFCGQGYGGVCLRRVSRCYCVRDETLYHMKHNW